MSNSGSPKTKAVIWGILPILVVAGAAMACLALTRPPAAPTVESSSVGVQGSSFETNSGGASKPEPVVKAPNSEPSMTASKDTGAPTSPKASSTGEVSKSGYAVTVLSDPIRPGRTDPAVPKEIPEQVSPTAKPSTSTPAEADAKPKVLSYSTLLFKYWPRPKDGSGKDPFPDRVRALNGSRVQIDGYVIPLEVEKGKMKSFLLSRGPFGCCYADSPQISEIIKVSRADGKPATYYSMARVTGLLEVGEEFDADGFIISVYRIKAETVTETPERR